MQVQRAGLPYFPRDDRNCLPREPPLSSLGRVTRLNIERVPTYCLNQPVTTGFLLRCPVGMERGLSPLRCGSEVLGSSCDSDPIPQRSSGLSNSSATFQVVWHVPVPGGSLRASRLEAVETGESVTRRRNQEARWIGQSAWLNTSYVATIHSQGEESQSVLRDKGTGYFPAIIPPHDGRPAVGACRPTGSLAESFIGHYHFLGS